MKKENWFIKNKAGDFEAIARKAGISPILARLLVNRGITEPEEACLYIQGDLSGLHSGFLLKDAEKASDILKDKIDGKKKIRIIGDYDVDGVMSVYILWTALRKAGALVDYAIPDRVRDGYGINKMLIEAAVKEQVDTILTCDNGIAALEEIKYAKKLGMTVIITDHHDISYDETQLQEGERKRCYKLPEADAVVNAKRQDCRYPFEQICGAVTAYKVMEVFCEKYGKGKKDMEQFLEFAAIATVCDVMDLVGENRIIVKNGIDAIRETTNIGLNALIKAASIEKGKIGAYHMGFILGPCINASGRLETAEIALKLLMETNAEEAGFLAKQLKEMNDQRKQMTSQGVLNAKEVMEQEGHGEDQVLVLFLPDCHESLAGIIAGRIREEYNKPVFILTKAEKGVKGSGRSIPEYSMYDRLCECSRLLERFGGHPMAAGLSLLEENIDELRRELNVRSGLTKESLIPRVTFDMVLPLSCATKELVREISLLEPFGKGNGKPLFARKNIHLVKGTVLGAERNVLKLSLKEDGDNILFQGILFQKTEAFEQYIMEKYGEKSLKNLYSGKNVEICLDIVYSPGINEYKGRESIQLVIEHYR